MLIDHWQVLEKNAELAAEAQTEYAIEGGVRSDAGFGVSLTRVQNFVTRMAPQT